MCSNKKKKKMIGSLIMMSRLTIAEKSYDIMAESDSE